MLGTPGFVMRLLAIALLLAMPAAPLVAEAQPVGKVHRVGVLSYLAPDMLQASLVTFREGLRQQGYVEGRTIAFELRTSSGRLDALPELAAELAGKQVELLKEALPRVSRVAVLRNPEQPVHVAKLKQTETVARGLGIRLVVVDARGAEDFDDAFTTMHRERAEGLIVFADGMFLAHRKHLVELASRLSLPGVYASNGFAQAGGLIAYVPDNPETYRRAASFVARILKGASPATLPVEQPTRFELTINLATARTLGLTIPRSLLIRADQVIE
jgi:putative ABC transport system substrate-binding protein